MQENDFDLSVLNMKVLRGPNYWSNFRQNLIVFKIDIKDYDEYPSNLIPGFPDRLSVLLPSLSDHNCSYGEAGGFIKRLHEGTWLGHVIEHVALELQVLAGMNCNFGRTRGASEPGVYYVLYEYLDEEAGIYAGETAIKLVQCLAKNMPFKGLADDIEMIKNLYDKNKLGPSTEAILTEAKKRHIPYRRLDDDSLVLLGHGCKQKLVQATLTSHTACIGLEFAQDKVNTKSILEKNAIPVPKGLQVNSLIELDQAINEILYPVVIKPLTGNHGRGVTTNIRNWENACAAFEIARQHSKDVLVENYVGGADYRFLVINYQLQAVAKREPPYIVGNGRDSIRKLIAHINENPLRGNAHENFLTKIKIDDTTEFILSTQQLTLDSILSNQHKLYLKNAANLSTGGTAIDVTDEVHPKNACLAERIARLFALDICGIDVIASDIKKPLQKGYGFVIEVNAGPGLRMHLAPSIGKPRHVAKPIIDMLYPKNSGRIPLIAVTGTNGKTTVVRLIAHLARQAGFKTGLTCTDGIYIDSEEICQGDCSGPKSAQIVLRDPAVEFAVLECARGGILRAGLGFDHSSVSVVTNISSDHLGIDDIHTLEDLRRVKEVVPRSTLKDGTTVLNAEDDLVYSMRENVECKIALFSFSRENERIRAHCETGGLVAYIDNDIVSVEQNHEITRIISVKELAVTFNGKSPCMIQNVLAATLAGLASNLSIAEIKAGLLSFLPTAEMLPGRMNIFEYDKCTLMMDYAHNEGAYVEIKKYLDNLEYPYKIGIIAGTGDRRNIDITKLGYLAAQIFDEIIIRHDVDTRGRDNAEMTQLLQHGIISYDPKKLSHVISDEVTALKFALEKAPTGSFIFYFPEDTHTGLTYLQDISHKVKLICVEDIA